MCVSKTATLEKQKQSVRPSPKHKKRKRESVVVFFFFFFFERAKCRRRRRVKDTREKMCKSGKKRPLSSGEEDLYCEALLLD